MSLPTLVKIANSLNVTLDDLVYDSITNNRGISVKEIDETLSDCSDDELKTIAETVKFAKSILRKNRWDTDYI